jgi:hypothetical protein
VAVHVPVIRLTHGAWAKSPAGLAQVDACLSSILPTLRLVDPGNITAAI